MTKFEFITAAIKKSDKKTLANILIHLADNFVVEEYLWNVYSDKDVGLIIKDDVNKNARESGT